MGASARVNLVDGCAEEQVERDREPPRRGENVRDRRFTRDKSRSVSEPVANRGGWSPTKPWKRLEQALRTTDLLLHSGGWGVVVLDFGSISWVDVRRIPLSTWFRFQRIVESTPAILVLLGEEPCARGCASVALRCRRSEEQWCRANSSATAHTLATFHGFEVEGEVVRSRAKLGHADTARWRTQSFWSRASGS